MAFAIMLAKICQPFMQRSCTVVCDSTGLTRRGGQLGCLVSRQTSLVESFTRNACLLNAEGRGVTHVGGDLHAPAGELVDAVPGAVSTLAGARALALTTVGGVRAHTRQRS